MSKETNQYIVQPDGWNCKLKNPYSPMDGLVAIDPKSKFWDFEATNPTFPIATDKAMQPGLVFEGDEVWQLYDHDREQWQDGNKPGTCTWEDFNRIWRTTRTAIQPKVVSPAKGEELQVTKRQTINEKVKSIKAKLQLQNDLLNQAKQSLDNANQILKSDNTTSGDNLPTESIEMFLRAAKYGYDYHSSTQFPEMSFDDNCKNNFLQALSNWQKSQPDNRVVVKDVMQAANEYALSTVKFDDSPLTTVQDDFIAGHSTATESFQSKLEDRIKELEGYHETPYTLAAKKELQSLLKSIKGE